MYNERAFHEGYNCHTVQYPKEKFYCIPSLDISSDSVVRLQCIGKYEDISYDAKILYATYGYKNLPPVTRRQIPTSLFLREESRLARPNVCSKAALNLGRRIGADTYNHGEPDLRFSYEVGKDIPYGYTGKGCDVII